MAIAEMECIGLRSLTPKFSCKRVNKSAWQRHAQPLGRIACQRSLGSKHEIQTHVD